MWKALEEAGDSQADATRRLKFASGRVSRFLYGVLVPSIAEGAVIRRVYGVPIPTWDLEPKKHFDPPALAAG